MLNRVSKGELAARYIIYVVLGFLSLVTLYPFWHVIMYSLSDSQAAMGGGLFLWPRKFSLLAYRLIFESRLIFRAYKNTIFVTFFGTVLNLMMTALTAYPLSRRRFRGRNIISMGIFFTMLFNGGLIPTFLIVYRMGLLNSRWSLIIPTAISAYNLFIMRNYFQSLPDSLEESANLDGATPLRTLIFIILPVSTPVIAAVAMFYGIYHWNAYIECVLYIDQPGKQVLQVFLRSMLGASALAQLSEVQKFEEVGGMTEETMKMATVTASVLPVLVVYPWLQKYYVKGVLIGSVKG